jgi:hypothetical protein
MAKESWRRTQAGGLRGEEPGRRKQGGVVEDLGDRVTEKSWTKNHGDVIVEDS